MTLDSKGKVTYTENLTKSVLMHVKRTPLSFLMKCLHIRYNDCLLRLNFNKGLQIWIRPRIKRLMSNLLKYVLLFIT